jgi:hypothetical protein
MIGILTRTIDTKRRKNWKKCLVKKPQMTLKVKIEEISFKDGNGVFMDVKVCEGYVEISTNDKDFIALDLEDWKQIDKEVRRIFKNMEE